MFEDDDHEDSSSEEYTDGSESSEDSQEDEDYHSGKEAGGSSSSGATFAEREIDGDFECVRLQSPEPKNSHTPHSRLVQNIRQRNDDPGLAKDWDFNIEDQEAEFRDDLRAASGVGRRHKGVRTTSSLEAWIAHPSRNDAPRARSCPSK